MISIVIPTLNEETVLRETMAALDPLTIPHEIIVSDGNSTDQTASIAKGRADQVVFYHGKTRQNIANARNLGAQSAHGAYLLFLDADVQIVHPQETLQALEVLFTQDPNLVGATIRLSVSPENQTWRDRLFFGLFNVNARFQNNLLHIGTAPGEFQFVRRSAFEQVGGFDERLTVCEDVDLFQRLSKMGKTRFVEEYQAYHTGRRVHKVGHLKLLVIWITNGLWNVLFHRSFNTEWRPIR